MSRFHLVLSPLTRIVEIPVLAVAPAAGFVLEVPDDIGLPVPGVRSDRLPARVAVEVARAVHLVPRRHVEYQMVYYALGIPDVVTLAAWAPDLALSWDGEVVRGLMGPSDPVKDLFDVKTEAVVRSLDHHLAAGKRAQPARVVLPSDECRVVWHAGRGLGLPDLLGVGRFDIDLDLYIGTEFAVGLNLLAGYFGAASIRGALSSGARRCVTVPG
jgi:hypothetical protein